MAAAQQQVKADWIQGTRGQNRLPWT